MSSVRRDRARAQQLSSVQKKVLSRALFPEEVETIAAVVTAEQCGQPYRAGRLGVAGSLVRRNWLTREADGSLRVSRETRLLLSEAAP